MMQASMRRMRLVSSVALAVVVVGGAALAQSVGTWKLNLEKSKYNLLQEPRSGTLVYEPVGAGIKVTVDQVPAEGPAIHYAYSADYDGKDVAVVGSRNGDTARSHAGECHDDEVGQQTGWTNRVHRNSCRIGRWDNPDDHYHRPGCQGAEH